MITHFIIYISVSYTHLDVYKRQVYFSDGKTNETETLREGKFHKFCTNFFIKYIGNHTKYI